MSSLMLPAVLALLLALLLPPMTLCLLG